MKEELDWNICKITQSIYLSRTWQTGAIALWIVVLLGVCLVIYYL